MKKLAILALLGSHLTGCSNNSKSSGLSAAISDLDISSWYEQLTKDMQQDPDFFTKAASTSNASFSNYGKFLSESYPEINFSSKNMRDFAALDKNFKSLGQLLKQENINLKSVTREEIRTALVVSKSKGTDESVQNLQSAAIAFKVALLFKHKSDAPSAGLALARRIPTAVPEAPPPAVTPPASTAGAATAAGPANASTAATAAGPATPAPAPAPAPAPGSTVQNLTNGAGAAGGLAGGGAAIAAAASGDKANEATINSQNAQGAAANQTAEAANKNSRMNRFCGTWTTGELKDYNSYMDPNAVRSGAKCPIGTRQAGNTPQSNTLANQRANDPSDPLSPKPDEIAPEAANAASTP